MQSSLQARCKWHGLGVIPAVSRVMVGHVTASVRAPCIMARSGHRWPHASTTDNRAAALVAQGAELEEQVTPSDLQQALDSFLDSKASAGPAAAAAAAAATGSSGTGHPLLQTASASTFAPPPPPPALGTAAPVTTGLRPGLALDQDVWWDSEQQLEKQLSPEPAAEQPGSFGGLSPSFLTAVQEQLEALGYDLTSDDIMRRLSADSGLADNLLPACWPPPGPLAWQTPGC
jgi:hypothetical protein